MATEEKKSVQLTWSFAIAAFLTIYGLSTCLNYMMQFAWSKYNLDQYLSQLWDAIYSTEMGEYLLYGWKDFDAGQWIFVDIRFVLAALLFYLAGISAGTRFMQGREPVDCKNAMRLYNLVLLGLSAFMCYTIFSEWSRLEYTVFCNQPNNNDMVLAAAVWLFYVSKTFEFLDTLWMILKKNNRQVSFLHVYHHASIFPFWYFITRGYPNGDAYWTAGLNSAVHTFMYAYYFLTSVGIRPPFKQMITVIQLTQFFLMLVQCYVGITSECALPRIFHWSLTVYLATMISLFGNFAIQTYVIAPRKAAAAKRAAAKAAKGQ
eukprot:TRINITY_DN168_c0_g1_i1.p1 TRINITY_DN168_c0_g1~~TRINITY_DN168_c0_g1_i1.p1  ORF type:complete len:341 (-),score=74.49 TRINITY_DN168_c0_g1_i1:128-1081(-)